MTIADRIDKDIVAAMKEKQAERLVTLRMVKSALKNLQILEGKPVEDAAAVQVLLKMTKQRNDSIQQFEDGGRKDLADKERSELKIIEAYVPSQPAESEIDQAIQTAIQTTGAASPKQMGDVMKAVMAAFAGRPVDGKALSAKVKQALEPK